MRARAHIVESPAADKAGRRRGRKKRHKPSARRSAIVSPTRCARFDACGAATAARPRAPPSNCPIPRPSSLPTMPTPRVRPAPSPQYSWLRCSLRVRYKMDRGAMHRPHRATSTLTRCPRPPRSRRSARIAGLHYPSVVVIRGTAADSCLQVSFRGAALPTHVPSPTVRPSKRERHASPPAPSLPSTTPALSCQRLKRCDPFEITAPFFWCAHPLSATHSSARPSLPPPLSALLPSPRSRARRLPAPASIAAALRSPRTAADPRLSWNLLVGASHE